MGRLSFRRILPILVPAVLFAAFALMVTFPSRVPFLNVRLKSSAGLGSERFSVPASAADRASSGFVMMRVPAGTAPGGTMDVPGALSVQKPFWLGRTEVTRGLYRAVAAGGDSLGYETEALSPPPGKSVDAAGAKADLLPAEGISWAGAVVWCNLLSERLGLEPAYRFPGLGGDPVRRVTDALSLCGTDGPALKADAQGFRLPSSAEWELAARYRDGADWTSGTWPSGGIDSWIEYSRSDLVAYYDRDGPAPAGSLASNALGLFDMSGNAWEWCFDPFPETDQAAKGPAKRVTRGGSWMGRAWRIQIGGTFGTPPGAREAGQGFRLARNGP